MDFYYHHNYDTDLNDEVFKKINIMDTWIKENKTRTAFRKICKIL